MTPQPKPSGNTRTPFAPLPVDHRLTSVGDANVWIAPRHQGGGTVNVLHFTDSDGQSHAIQLDNTDLARISHSATLILTATPEDIDGWLDSAAILIQKTLHCHDSDASDFFCISPGGTANVALAVREG